MARAMIAFVSRLDLLRVEETHVDVEIEARLLRRDVPAGDRRDDDARHHVQRRVKAHERVAAVPVDALRHDVADRERRACVDRVHHAVRRFAFARVRHCDDIAVLAHQRAGVADLAAALRIEDRAVEHDPALVDMR